MPGFAFASPFWILAGLAAATGVAALWLAARARAPGKAPEKAYVARLRGLAAKGGPLGRLLEALAYLFTSREQRYELPWTLILGEKGAGKSSLLRSAAAQLRHNPPDWAEKLELPHAEWTRFEHGVLIDPEGRVCDTRGGESRHGKDWRTLLDRIDDLRPERPLDKIVLAVSARSLLASGEDALLDLARDALRQMQDTQHRFEFALPVYVVVTQCDAVPGFSAFWRAQAAARRGEIFGWTAPPAFRSEEPPAWIEAAFSSLCQRLRQLLLTVSAEADNLANESEATELDRFFLFPVSFRRLQAPLARWFEEVFQPSDWEQSFFCRGIYFTGGVAADGADLDGPRGDVDFLRDLLVERVFAEPHLAEPARKRIWSRNRLIRRAQIAALAALVGLFTLLGFAGVHLSQQMSAMDAAMRTLVDMRGAADPGTCLEVGRFHDILRQVSRIEARSTYLAIPLSWIDDRAIKHGAEEISNASLEKVVMPAVACRLARKAQALVADGSRPEAGDDGRADPLRAPRRRFLDYVAAVRALEDNLASFRVASRFASAEENKASLRLFADLAAYAYDQPLPKEVMAEHGALSASLARITFDASVPLPAGARARYAQRIEALAAALRATLTKELEAGPVLLAKLERPDAHPGADRRGESAHLIWWLEWMRKSWLGSTAAHNPCEEVRGAAQPALADMVRRHGYPESLASLAETFGEALCYRPAMNTLIGLSVAPHGLMFGMRGGVLELNPDLTDEFAGLGALMDLPYMRLAPRQDFACRIDGAGWNPAQLAQAAGYARDYMKFAVARGLPAKQAEADPDQADGRRPLYDRLAREQLEAVMNDTLRAAQLATEPAPARGGVSDLSDAERRLARESADFAGAAAPLLETLGLYRQLGFADSAQRITRCARGLAADNLRRTQTLADNSRLYDLALEGDAGARMLDDLALTKDWLARQVARARVLTGYASQYLAFLKNSRDDGQDTSADTRGAAFWDNTLVELERYLQFKEPSGQVAALHSLFTGTVAGPREGCRKRLADYKPPELGDDLFSTLRRQRLAEARWDCSERPGAAAFAAWSRLADRFNRELAGRYPFGPLSSPDAAPGLVKSFLADYAGQRGALADAFADTSQGQWADARRFLARMDAVADFFRDTLSVDPASAPLRIGVEFNALAKASPGANQIVAWSLGNGAAAASLPNGADSLEWAWGQPLELRLAWASGSRWRPVADSARVDLNVDGASAVFAGEGPWSLLRMIQRHRAAALPDPLAPGRVLLAFEVPTTAAAPSGQSARAAARPHIALTLAAKDAKTGAPAALLPPAFPTLAPGNDKE